ncbi:ExbD/TolR family protein [Flavihumibacter sp. UBA7668]|uniref:ExbD/TolR family protein n=1 Tax=Flavihumibacter sp. UBA7668 TaxID=1946542 RepID=UPI0025C73E17|nr:biopolymer transporter ExbD [Flavihumibacter sp. UBA7668]
MAEMQTNAAQNSKRAGVAQSKKRSTRVDLTPMVDLGFLLITFFIFTTTMSENTAMKFNLPADGEQTNVANSTTLTLIPTENNELIYFHGQLTEAIQLNLLGKTSFQSTNGVGDLLREKRKALTALGKLKDFTVLIYPDQLASYKNIVDVMDELLINAVPVYCLSDNLPTIEKAKLALVSK